MVAHKREKKFIRNDALDRAILLTLAREGTSGTGHVIICMGARDLGLRDRGSMHRRLMLLQARGLVSTWDPKPPNERQWKITELGLDWRPGRG